MTVQEPTVARCHAEIQHDGHSGYHLVDTGSFLGTSLNRCQCAQAAQHGGDELWLGKARFTFHHPATTTA